MAEASLTAVATVTVGSAAEMVVAERVVVRMMVSLEVGSVSDLLQFCGGVLILALSSLLISRRSAH